METLGSACFQSLVLHPKLTKLWLGTSESESQMASDGWDRTGGGSEVFWGAGGVK